MDDVQVRTDGQHAVEVDQASEEIARSLGAVWRQFSGQRPKSTSVEVGRNSITCVIQEDEAPAVVDEGEGADEAEGADEEPTLSEAGLKHNAMAAITRITGRRVVAFIPKRDKTAKTSTQKFLFDTPPPRY